jgi:hypothetical protein
VTLFSVARTTYAATAGTPPEGGALCELLVGGRDARRGEGGSGGDCGQQEGGRVRHEISLRELSRFVKAPDVDCCPTASVRSVA